jgi:hypothetical protein
MLNINDGGVLVNLDPEMRRRVTIVARLAKLSREDALKVILQLAPGTFRLRRRPLKVKALTIFEAKTMAPFSLN